MTRQEFNKKYSYLAKLDKHEIMELMGMLLIGMLEMSILKGQEEKDKGRIFGFINDIKDTIDHL